MISDIYKYYLMPDGSPATIDIKGDCMLPRLKDGWRAKIRPVQAEEINAGDIIVFFRNGLFCHRIKAKFRWNGKLYFLQTADISNIAGRIDGKDLVGKVVEVFDKEGNKINEEKWKVSFEPSIKSRILIYVYIPMFLIKRLAFGMRQNKLTRLIKRGFWHIFK